MSSGDLSSIANFIWGSLPEIAEFELAGEPIDDEDLDAAVDDTEDEEVAV